MKAGIEIKRSIPAFFVVCVPRVPAYQSCFCLKNLSATDGKAVVKVRAEKNPEVYQMDNYLDVILQDSYNENK